MSSNGHKQPVQKSQRICSSCCVGTSFRSCLMKLGCLLVAMALASLLWDDHDTITTRTANIGTVIKNATVSVTLKRRQRRRHYYFDTNENYSETDSDNNNNYPCAAQPNGRVVVNMNGRLGNNLFQLALANSLSQDLCWPMVVREHWQGVFPLDERANECFPDALQAQGNVTTALRDDQNWFDSMHVKESSRNFWSTPSKFFHSIQYRETNDLYEQWLNETQREGTSLKLGSRYEFKYYYDADLNHNWYHDLVDNFRVPNSHSHQRHLQRASALDTSRSHTQGLSGIAKTNYSQIRTIHLDAFFIHYGWMQPRMESIRRQLQMHSSCCMHATPTSHTVLLHLRNFHPEERQPFHVTFESKVYRNLLEKYYFKNDNERINNDFRYELWIVCPPEDVELELVQTLHHHYNATIIPGYDAFDAFCILQHATHLVLATHSTFSQMAALLGNHHDVARQVHYLLPTLDQPEVTLVVPTWHYHWVAEDLERIQEYDIDSSRIRSIMS